MRKASILQKTRKCFFCGREDVLHLHHVYEGANKHVSDANGFTVWLCPEHHRQCHEEGLDKPLKAFTQKVYEKKHTRDEFLKLIGKNYRGEE